MSSRRPLSSRHLSVQTALKNTFVVSMKIGQCNSSKVFLNQTINLLKILNYIFIKTILHLFLLAKYQT
ncbi:hypothetical protein DSUL_30066 [Desulfovibrionales bacterium]